jgi:hypothetical protein
MEDSELADARALGPAGRMRRQEIAECVNSQRTSQGWIREGERFDDTPELAEQ